MSKRVTLTDLETEQIVNALIELKKQPALSYEVIKAGQRYYDEIIKKLQTEPNQNKE